MTIVTDRTQALSRSSLYQTRAYLLLRLTLTPLAAVDSLDLTDVKAYLQLEALSSSVNSDLDKLWSANSQ